MVLTLWENGSLVGVSSHEGDETVENTVIVNPTSSASPSYEAIKDSELSRISSVETRAWGYDENLTDGARVISGATPRTHQHMYRIGE